MAEKTSDGYRLRAASNRDRKAAITLVKRILPTYGLRYDASSDDADLEDIEEAYLEPGGAFEVLEDARGAVVGTFAFEPAGDGSCRLRKMYLDPALRGRGLGLRMLERAVARAREMGFKKMVLETASVLEEAIKLYTRFGFKRLESSPHSTRCDQVYFLDL